jgi:hypothetical protein
MIIGVRESMFVKVKFLTKFRIEDTVTITGICLMIGEEKTWKSMKIHEICSLFRDYETKSVSIIWTRLFSDSY